MPGELLANAAVQRAVCEPSRRAWLCIGLGILSTLVATPWPLDASCQTLECYRIYNQDDLDHEVELWRAVTEQPGDERAWTRLAQSVRQKVGRMRFLAAFHARFDWQMQDSMQPGYEAALRAEYQEVSDLWLAAQADMPRAWCARAASEKDVAVRLDVTTAGVARLPDSTEVLNCHLESLLKAERFDDAVAVAKTFRDRRVDDPAAHMEFIGLLEGLAQSGKAAKRFEAKGRLEEAERYRRRVAFAPAPAALEEAYAQLAKLDDVDAQRSVAKYEVRVGRPGDAADRLIAQSKRSLTIWERSNVCDQLDGIDVQVSSEVRDCYQRGLTSAGDAIDPEDREFLEEQVVYVSMREEDWSALDALLAPHTPADRLMIWLRQDADEPASCARFATDLARGWLAPAADADATTLDWIRVTFHLCDMPERAARWRERADAAKREEAARNPESATPTRLRRTPEHAEAYRKRAQNDPSAHYPVEALFAIAVLEDDFDTAAALLDDAAPRGPRGLDVALRIGAWAASLKREDIVRDTIAHAAAARDATPRQRAETDFLRGRLARWAGRLDEASDHFERYFLLRHRFEGCEKVDHCDRAFVLHMIEAGDFARLDTYRAQRAEARRFNEASVPWYFGESRVRAVRRASQVDDPISLARRTTECVPVGTIDFLVAQVAKRPEDEPLRKRLAGARTRPRCADSIDPDVHFRDRVLFEFVTKMRYVD